jgi:hypothetical protein
VKRALLLAILVATPLAGVSSAHGLQGATSAQACHAPKAGHNQQAIISVHVLRARRTSCHKARQVARARLRQRLAGDGTEPSCKYHETASTFKWACKVGSWDCVQVLAKGSPVTDVDTCVSGSRRVAWHWRDTPRYN